MKRTPTTTPTTPPRATGEALDAPAVLARARRVLWRLRLGGAAVDVQAAAAVTSGRHGEQGRRWAAGILKAVEGGADVGTAIERAMTSKGQVTR